MPLTEHHSIVRIVTLGLVAGGVLAVFAWRSRGIIGKCFWLLLALCLLVPSGIMAAGMNPWLVDARYRTYRLFYWSINLGMTHDEVLALMNRSYPLGESRLRPIIVEDSPARLGFHMNPEQSSEPDHEGIFLRMQGEKVIGKDYSPDTLGGP